jgi:PEP-CTERM motif
MTNNFTLSFKQTASLKYALLALIALSTPMFADVVNYDFSAPVLTSPTDAPGTWYVDRAAPAGFVSQTTAPDGTLNTLKESISGTAKSDIGFYNTQGYKLDLPAGTHSVSIDLYVPLAWATDAQRLAGVWGTVVDSTNAVQDFPIVEFQGPTPTGSGPYPNVGTGTLDTGAGFYGWDNVTGTFDYIGLPTGFTYDSWVPITLALDPTGASFNYVVGNLVQSSPEFGTGDASISNVILQGYNAGTDNAIYWNNLSVSTTPEPSTGLLLGGAAAGLLLVRRRLFKG